MEQIVILSKKNNWCNCQIERSQYYNDAKGNIWSSSFSSSSLTMSTVPQKLLEEKETKPLAQIINWY